MSNRSARVKGPLDAARGRSDSAAELRRHLAAAPPPYLQGALDNAETGEEEVLLLLANRAATPAILGRIARERRWVRLYEVKKAIVRHSRTPPTLARSLLPHLYWRDVADAVEDLRIAPSVRRQAEETLKQRVQDLTVGERVTLARRASRAVIAALGDSREPKVLRALLGNARLVESDAVRIASSEQAPPVVLGEMAEHPTWGARYPVRIALLANPRTPVPAALHLVEKLPRQDLQRLSRDGKAPRIVRVGADRLLQSRAGKGRTG